jgi:hypothetical protein
MLGTAPSITPAVTPENRPCGSREFKRRSVAEWLRRGPVAGCEMRVADEEQLDLVEPAELRKACRQETA